MLLMILEVLGIISIEYQAIVENLQSQLGYYRLLLAMTDRML